MKYLWDESLRDEIPCCDIACLSQDLSSIAMIGCGVQVQFRVDVEGWGLRVEGWWLGVEGCGLRAEG